MNDATQNLDTVIIKATNHDTGAKDMTRVVERKYAERSAQLQRQCGYRNVVILER